ncbi:hypothetical protein HNY42_08165 [Exiguobacterium sp. Helios]|uniref:hypothetical protein n=1 Tax=Exiguobacterium sp. Helios TaxID=2735868 RepID=UPI00165E1B5D|nr:hypothetical protein [Exiguobacterium sp. Helios]QNR20909.1 hypothetical protein HNY42_08165 [Exiguobacterium sp. Helios]
MIKNFPALLMLTVAGIVFMRFLSDTEMVPFLKIILTLVGLVMILSGIIGMMLHGWVIGYERNRKRM